MACAGTALLYFYIFLVFNNFIMCLEPILGLLVTMYVVFQRQFQLKNLEELYLKYLQRLHLGYFSVFVVLQSLLSLSHTTVLWIIVSMSRLPRKMGSEHW
jgi:hypothetical protein